MSEKVPQSTDVLVKRLQRLARVLDGYAKDSEAMGGCGPMRERKPEAWRAFANTCWQAAGRLEAQLTQAGSLRELTTGGRGDVATD